jgi:hypothetical protein
VITVRTNIGIQFDIAGISADGFNAPPEVRKPTFRRSNRRQPFH